jgi:PAS domain S-box-containing protein
MRIRTQFIITMLLSGTILLVIAVSEIITSQQLEKAGQQEGLSTKIAQGASELSYLSNDYMIYREGQQLKRWQSRFTSFSGLIAGLNVDKPEQQALVRNIRGNQNRFKEVFDSVASAQGGSPQSQSVTSDPAFLQVSWSRMAVQSRELVSDASRLSQLLRLQMDQLTKTNTTLMYVMTGLFGVFLLASYLLTYRRILSSIATLHAGTTVVGSGKLNFIIEEGNNDEIGELSRAFNRMTANLKAVTASKADLEREIVERKRVEEELRWQREWFRVTLTSIGDAVITTDASGRITFLNPVAHALTGWQPEEAVGQPIQAVFRIINEQSGEPAEDIVQRVLQIGSVVTLANNTAIITREGQIIPIEDSAAPIKDNEGNISGVVLVFHDVTGKRRAHEALRESEKRYRNLFETMNEGFALHEIICDDRGRPCDYRFLEVNPAFERHTGFKAADLVGHTLYEVLPQSESLWVERYGSVALNGQPARFDHWSEALGRHYEISAFQANRGRFGVLFLDVTDRKKAETFLRLANEQLEDKVQERTAALTQTVDVLQEEIKHREIVECELKLANEQLAAKANQLRALAGELTMAEHAERKRLSKILHDGLQQHLASAKLQLGDLADRLAGDDFKQAGEIEKTIADSIQISRSLSADLSPPVFHEGGLSAGLEWLARWMRDKYKLNVELSIEDKPQLPEDVMIFLFESVRELLFNTFKHARVSRARVRMRQIDGAGLQITVSDEGAGFDPCQLKPAGEEGGFGLFCIRERIGLIGGSIQIDSAPGKGSRMALMVPHGPAPDVVPLSADRMCTLVAEPQEDTVKDKGTTIRVLLADDHALFRNGLGRLLKNEPCLEVVGQAADGKEAIELAQKLKPDVILMDISMPKVNGIEATQIIHGQSPGIRIIGLSMYEDQEHWQAMRDAGAADYKTKGCAAAEIVAAIRACLQERESSLE